VGRNCAGMNGYVYLAERNGMGDRLDRSSNKIKCGGMTSWLIIL